MLGLFVGLVAIVLYMMIIFKARKKTLNEEYSYEDMPYDTSGDVDDLHLALNEIREEYRLQPLFLDFKLTRTANTRCEEMIEEEELSHKLAANDFADMIALGLDSVGENIGYGYSTIPAVVKAWMNSPAHKKNLLNPSWRYVGIGIVLDEIGKPYYCTMFGSDGN